MKVANTASMQWMLPLLLVVVVVVAPVRERETLEDMMKDERRSDLMMLHVACSLVESRGAMSSSEEAERLEATTFKVEAPRIPQLFPSTNSSFALRGRHHRQPNLHPNQQPPSQQQQQPFHQRSAADIMLGLKTLATHADRQVPVIHVHDRSSMPSFPSLRPSSSSGHAHRSTATGFLPPIVAVDRDQQSSSRGAISPPTGEKSQCHKVAPVPFVEYLGRKNKRGEPRLPDNATSPTSRFSAPSSERERDITLSPLSTGE